MIDLMAALPPRKVDPRIARLYRKFGASKVFSLDEGAEALQVSQDVAWRLLFIRQIEDSLFRVGINNGKFWLLAQNPFKAAAEVWMEQYRETFRGLPSPFSASDFSRATGVPFAAANTLLSVLRQHDHLAKGNDPSDSNDLYRLPRRKVTLAA